MSTRMIQKQFKRKESKHIVNKACLTLFLQDLKPYMVEDEYAQSQISSIYFDTEDFSMIRDALDKKYSREKVRMRFYGEQSHGNHQAFLEIKKKVEKVGYKYRLVASPSAIVSYVTHGVVDASMHDPAVMAELTQLRQRYGQLEPKMLIQYQRHSYQGREDKGLRLTIDQDLLYQELATGNLSTIAGYDLLASDHVIMEIKYLGDLPAWLTSLLEKHEIEKGSFSKYGTAYRLAMQESREEVYAVV